MLVLFRHGPAAERSAAAYPDDDLRPLTPRGRKRVKAAARGLRALGFAPERVLFSPAERTRETAAIVAGVFRLEPSALVLEPALHPDADPGVLVRRTLRTGSGRPHRRGRVLWVGHEPWLGEAAGLLTGGAAVTLRKAGAAFIEIPPGGVRRRGVLRALMPPEWLVAAGGG